MIHTLLYPRGLKRSSLQESACHQLIKELMMKEIHLTPRQEDIVRILKRTGASNKIIARQLQISESTVKLHVTAILNKFAVRSRLQLVVLLQDHNI